MPPVVTRLQVGLQPAERMADSLIFSLSRSAMVLTADGRTLIFSGREADTVQLYRRDLDQPEAVPLEGTDGAVNPFLSPDEQWVGFWAAGEVRKVPIEGGPAVSLCETERLFGASWGPDNRIVFARAGGGLWQVSGDGGTAAALTTLDVEQGEVSHRLPFVLPGGDAVLYTVRDRPFGGWGRARVVVESLETGDRHVLVENAADARFVSTGHLVFVRFATLMAAPFDLEQLELTGGPVALLDGVGQALNAGNSDYDTGAAHFTTSESGALVYAPGGTIPDPQLGLAWYDHQGVAEPLPMERRGYNLPRVSPDGRRIAFQLRGAERDIWVYEIDRGVATRLTADWDAAHPVWSPDSRRLAFAAAPTGSRNLYVMNADGTGEPVRLTAKQASQAPASWTPDGETLVFHEGGDIWTVSVNDPTAPRTVLNDPSAERHPNLSHDGRWLAYDSNVSGRREVYMQPFAREGPRVQLSADGGTSPVWAPDDRRLYYIMGSFAEGAWMMAVDLTGSDTLTPGIAQRIFELPSDFFHWSDPVRGYDVSPDGTRFLSPMTLPNLAPATRPITELKVILNWTQELLERVPVP